MISYLVTDGVELLESLPAGSVSAVITSPPYNLGLKPRRSTNWDTNRLRSDGYAYHDDDMPRPEYVKWQRRAIGAALEVVGDAGVAIWQHKPLHRQSLVNLQGELFEGFPVRQVVIWDRDASNNHNIAFPCPPSYEFIVFMAQRTWKPPEGAYQVSRKWGAVWRIHHAPPSNQHPAPFPLELARRMCAYAHMDGLVVDPFAGSGTVGVAAAEMALPCIMADVDPKYRTMWEERVNRISNGGKAE